MKKNFNLAFAALAAFATVLSCAKVEEPENNYKDEAASAGQITISATLSDALTKVAFTPSYDTDGKPANLTLAWEAGDKLRVYNHADRTQFADFDLVEGSVGQKIGYFTGTAPVAESYDIEVVNGEVDYAEQTQPADGVTTSLKYLASVSAVTTLTSVEFTDYSSVLAITAKMPEGAAAAVSSVELSASEAIFSTGKTLTINLAQKGDAGNDGVLNLFATLPQGDSSIADGTTLLVTFNAPDTDHTVYTRFVELDAQTFAAGKLNTISINASQSGKHAGVVSCDGSSAEKAYLIGDKCQMQAMGSLMTADATTYFKMVDDVDFGGSAWTPVAGKVAFDGQYHKISNVTAASGLFSTLDGSVQNLTIDAAAITEQEESAVGVLANLASDDVTIKNVTVTNSTVSSTSDYAGGLVGKLDGGVVENVNVDCDVTNTKANTGGLIGRVMSGTIKNCSATGNVTSDFYYAAGLVGYVKTAEITNCYATGKVISNRANYARSGGFVGEITGGSIKKCYATGDVDIKGAYAGGLIGVIDDAFTSLTQSYATGAVTQLNEKNYNGGLVGWITDKCKSATIANCYATGSIAGKNYCSGFVGYVQGVTSITNCYTKSAIDAAKWSGCVFGGNVDPVTNLSLTGFIGWNVSQRVAFWYNQSEALEGNYMGTEGTISAKAKEFGWDETIWDLSGDEPTLK